MSGQRPKVARFGLFEADFEQFVLTKAGLRIKLQEQPFQVLEMLVERPGELVTRNEIGEKLWSSDTFVEFDDGLNTAVRKLRSALGDVSDNPRFIETIPRKGYRFIAPVAKGPVGSETPETPAQAPPTSDARTHSQPVDRARPRAFGRKSVAFLAVATLCAVGIALAVRSRLESSPRPHVIRITQLTHSGALHPNQNLATDGLRLYYIERANGDWTLKSMPSGGGIGVKLTIPLPRYDLQDLSPDASQMLLRQIGSDENYSLWIMPIVGGPARRVGDLRVDAATFTADGKSVTYSKGPRAYVCDTEGQNSRLLVSMKGDILRMRWSPRGDVLRFTVNDPTLHENSLWEVRVDGSNLHPLLPGWERSKWEWMLGWSRDARWFAFSAAHDNGRDIWIMQHDPSSTRPDQGPYQLTTGPIEFDLPIFGVDSSRLYAVGVQHRGELLRFNPTNRAFDPYLGGISADQLDFSHDGKWVTYVTYPERVLWRARLDGSEALKLNEKSLMVLAPKWSPDGRQIAYLARTSRNTKWQAFIVSANGGLSRPAAPGTDEITGVAWADHGAALILSSPAWEGLRTLNLATGKIMDLKGSAHLHGGIASPSGRYLIGSVDDGDHLEIMDLLTLERRPLAHDANYPAWSSDERYIYLNRFDGSRPALYRVRVSDMKEEKVFDLHAFPAGGSWSTWSTVAPDGSLLVLRDLGGADLYAVDWQSN